LHAMHVCIDFVPIIYIMSTRLRRDQLMNQTL
jgi:hypothetical protein